MMEKACQFGGWIPVVQLLTLTWAAGWSGSARRVKHVEEKGSQRQEFGQF